MASVIRGSDNFDSEAGSALKAWVNFDGNAANIRSSYNVSSITYTGVGQYTVNFTTAMSDTFYSTVLGSADNATAFNQIELRSTSFYSTTAVSVLCSNNRAYNDHELVSIAIFR